jgi:hypothetical protein
LVFILHRAPLSWIPSKRYARTVENKKWPTHTLKI